MRSSSIFTILVFILAVFGLFLACEDPNKSIPNSGVPIIVPGAGFNEKKQWLDANVQSGNTYILEFDTDQSIRSTTFSYRDMRDITITLKSVESKQVMLSRYGEGTLFVIESGITLILDDKIELRGGWGVSISYPLATAAPLIQVNSGGTLILNQGARITGGASYANANLGASSFVSGVYVHNGTFTMNGGEISGNTASHTSSFSSPFSVGGVYVDNGTFTMNGGEISDNTAVNPSSSIGGVYVNNGTFTMNGGKISDNTASDSSSSIGGVCVNNGSFTMNGGEICGNTISSFYPGGGVYVSSGTFTMVGGEISNNSGRGVYVNSGTFIMDGGEISGNTSSSGGGVYVADGIFTMSGGKISGYTASGGGGVYVAGTFTMSGGEISDNVGHASVFNGGGGVYVDGYFDGSVFNKTGGTIFGYSLGESNSNVVKDNGTGVVQNKWGHAIHILHIMHSNDIFMGKDTTSGPGDKLSFNGTATPHSWSGEWDYEWNY
jgi:hypothetical protein